MTVKSIQPPGGTTTFLRADGTYAAPSTAKIGGVKFDNPSAILIWDFQTNGTTWGHIRGVVAPSFASGTAAGHIPVETTYYTSRRKIRYNIAVTSTAQHISGNFNQQAGSGAQMFLGSLATTGGGYMKAEFGTGSANAVANWKCYFGLAPFGGGEAVLNNTTTQPSSGVNIIGVGWDTGDANLQIMHNDGSGTATKVNLGANFPVTRDTDWYMVEWEWAKNASSVSLTVTNKRTGNASANTLSSNLPANTIDLRLVARLGNHDSNPGGNMSMDFGHVYAEVP